MAAPGAAGLPAGQGAWMRVTDPAARAAASVSAPLAVTPSTIMAARPWSPGTTRRTGTVARTVATAPPFAASTSTRSPGTRGPASTPSPTSRAYPRRPAAGATGPPPTSRRVTRSPRRRATTSGAPGGTPAARASAGTASAGSRARWRSTAAGTDPAGRSRAATSTAVPLGAPTGAGRGRAAASTPAATARTTAPSPAATCRPAGRRPRPRPPGAAGHRGGTSGLEARSGERGRARAGALARHRGEQGVEQVPQPRVVLLEHADDLGVGDRGDAGQPLEADVVVGDQRDVHVADLELAGERRLRVAGHVDDPPAGALEPLGLRSGGEAGTLDHDHRAAVVHGDAELLGLLHRELAQLRAVGVGEGDVRRLGAVVERVGPAPGPVDHLVADDEVARGGLGLQGAGRARPDDPGHAELLHGPQVGAVVDPVRRELVAAAVAGEEGDRAPVHL